MTILFKGMMMPVIAALAAVTLIGCGSGDHFQAAASPQHESAVVPEHASWALLYTASCSSGAAESCAGAYGFTLWNDGRYEVGPGPQGQLVRGWIQRKDVEGLRAHLASLRLDEVNAEFASSSSHACATPPAGQSAAEVRLVSGERSRVLLMDSGASFCSDASLVPTTANAQDLENWIKGMAQKYSPPLFPNPCVDAASALDQKYSGIRSCQSDIDCAYVDENLLPIETSIATRVVSDDCSYIQPLVVANRFLAVTNQRDLLLERELARKVCGGNLTKTQCTHPYSFDPTAGAPICQEGVCTINPSAKKGL